MHSEPEVGHVVNIIRGDSYTSDAGSEIRWPINSRFDLTGATLEFWATGPTRLEFAPTPDNSVQLMLELTPEQTAQIPSGRYVYDLLAKWPDGSRRTLIRGEFVVQLSQAAE